MTIEIAIVFGIILLAILFFITEWLSIDTVAFGIMVILLVTGLVTPQQGIMGFANQATINGHVRRQHEFFYAHWLSNQYAYFFARKL